MLGEALQVGRGHAQGAGGWLFPILAAISTWLRGLLGQCRGCQSQADVGSSRHGGLGSRRAVDTHWRPALPQRSLLYRRSQAQASLVGEV